MIEFAQRIKEKILLVYKMNVYFMYLVYQCMQGCEESSLRGLDSRHPQM